LVKVDVNPVYVCRPLCPGASACPAIALATADG